MTSHRFVAGPDDARSRLDRFLATRLPGLSRTSVARLVDEGAVLVNEKRPKRSQALVEGDVVTCSVPAPASPDVEGEDLPLAVLHEDEDVAVVDKAAGVVVHPGAGRASGTLVNALVHRFGEGLRGVGGARRPGIVHRLDKGTTGVMVVAKTPAAYRSLTAQFLARTVEKVYFAVVLGVPAPTGEIDAAISRSRTDRTRMTTRGDRGRQALTRWRVLEPFGSLAASLSVELLTGRTHQVRVHLASVGNPLVGDSAYASGRLTSVRDARARGVVAGFPRPALHAWRLAFDHPADGRRLRFEAPIPTDLVELVASLKRLADAAEGRGRRG